MLTIFGYDEQFHKCVPCINAKRLAEKKGLEYQFISVVKGKDENGPIFNEEVIQDLLDKLGRESKIGLTMPQIFDSRGTSIGGFAEMIAWAAKK